CSVSISVYKSSASSDHYALSLHDALPISGEDAFIKAAIHAGAKHRIPIIAHNDVRFLEQDDFDAHEARVCIAGSYVLADPNRPRSEEHTSELQSRFDLVCRLLLEKKNMMA